MNRLRTLTQPGALTTQKGKGRVFWLRQAELVHRYVWWLAAASGLMFLILLLVDASNVGGSPHRLGAQYVPGRILGLGGALLTLLSGLHPRARTYSLYRVFLLNMCSTLAMAHASLVTWDMGGSPGTFVLVNTLAWSAMTLPPVWAATGAGLSSSVFISGLTQLQPGPLDTLAFEAVVNTVILSILAVLARDFLVRRDYQIFLSQQELDLARRKSEELLLCTLPAEVVRELKQDGWSPPRLHKDVTVMFADLVGFSRYAEHMEPGQLVMRLDALFSAFDVVARRHGLEKLKTIGDCYMCAAGLISRGPNPAASCVAAALEMAEIARRQAPVPMPGTDAPIPVRVRIGLHTGSVVAGVIGQEKFLYDIWGDTVNQASMVESLGEPDRVTISSDVWERVRDDFTCESIGLRQGKHGRELDLWRVMAHRPTHVAADPVPAKVPDLDSPTHAPAGDDDLDFTLDQPAKRLPNR